MLRNKKIILLIVLVGVVVLAYIIDAPLIIMNDGAKHIFKNLEAVTPHGVGIVFGAGIIANAKPKDILRDRLVIAAELYREGKIKKILVSGDNSALDYNEPNVMFDYLVGEEKIPASDVVRDYAGRSTYETCARAHEIWGVDNALLITQGYHLPRALLLCNKLGIKSDGISTSIEPYVASTYFKLREFFAIHKAILQLYILPPAYVHGDKEFDLIGV